MGNEEEKITEVLVKSMMSVHEGAKRRVKVDSVLSEEFEVKAQAKYAVVIDVDIELEKDGE